MPRTRPRRGAQTALFERNMPPTAAAHNAEGSPGRTGSTRDPARAGPRNLMAERVKLAPARVDDGLDAPRVCMQTPSRPRVWPGDDLCRCRRQTRSDGRISSFHGRAISSAYRVQDCTHDHQTLHAPTGPTNDYNVIAPFAPPACGTTRAYIVPSFVPEGTNCRSDQMIILGRREAQRPRDWFGGPVPTKRKRIRASDERMLPPVRRPALSMLLSNVRCKLLIQHTPCKVPLGEWGVATREGGI